MSTKSWKRSLVLPWVGGSVAGCSFWATCLVSGMQGMTSGPSRPKGLGEKAGGPGQASFERKKPGAGAEGTARLPDPAIASRNNPLATLGRAGYLQAYPCHRRPDP